MAEVKKYISKVAIQDDAVYDIKDAEARSLIEALTKGKLTITVSTSADTTPLGVTWYTKDKVKIEGNVEPNANVNTIYLVPLNPVPIETPSDVYVEFVCAKKDNIYVWEKLGDTEINFSSLGKMAQADEAVTAPISLPFGFGASLVKTTKAFKSKQYTPAGTIIGGDYTFDELSSTASYKPEGSVSIASFSPKGTNADSQVTFGPNDKVKGEFVSMTSNGEKVDGSAAKFSASVSEEILSFSFIPNTPTQVTLPTGNSITVLTDIKQGTAKGQIFTGSSTSTTGSFSGTPATITAKGTITGTQTGLSFEGTPETITTDVTTIDDVTVTVTDTTELAYKVTPVPKPQQ